MYGPGGLAHNAFNSSILEPYTGRLEIANYLDDLQLPQMLELVTTYESEIMVRGSYTASERVPLIDILHSGATSADPTKC